MTGRGGHVTNTEAAGLTVSVSESSVVVGHGDEVVAARRVLDGRALPQQEAGEIQISATRSAVRSWF